MTQNLVVMEWDYDVIMQVDIDTAYTMADIEIKKRHGNNAQACIQAYRNGEHENIVRQIMDGFGYTSYS